MLHVATERGHTELIEALLKGKADINAVDKSGNTALHYACYSGIHKLQSI